MSEREKLERLADKFERQGRFYEEKMCSALGDTVPTPGTVAINCAIEVRALIPKCSGFPDCDGDLPGENHDEACALYVPPQAGPETTEKIDPCGGKAEVARSEPCSRCGSMQGHYKSCDRHWVVERDSLSYHCFPIRVSERAGQAGPEVAEPPAAEKWEWCHHATSGKISAIVCSQRPDFYVAVVRHPSDGSQPYLDISPEDAERLLAAEPSKEPE